MLKFDEEKQINSVNGALALRSQINEIVDGICKDGYKNICWLGIGGTYASCLQAEVHMKEKSELPFFVENAAEYLTTGNKKVGEGTIVIISSVTGISSAGSSGSLDGTSSMSTSGTVIGVTSSFPQPKANSAVHASVQRINKFFFIKHLLLSSVL